MSSALQLLHAGPRRWREILERGHSLAPAEVADSEYAGISLGLPRIVEKLSWKKFMKAFHLDPERGVVRGWNVRMEQNALDGPWIPKVRGTEAVTFGHFLVVEARGARVPAGCDRGVLLDYGRGRNARFDPMGLMRDPVVAVNEGDASLLLGWSYLQLPGFTIPTPSYFTLERLGPLTHRSSPCC
jgi:hypothetical protein